MTTFHSQHIIDNNITIIPRIAMNLKLEDLSQYIVLLIFILVIIKVLGAGFSTTLMELLTGKKKEEEFDLDTLVKRKANQLNFSNPPSTQEKQNLKTKINQLEGEKKQVLIELLNSLEWGDIIKTEAPESTKLLTDFQNTRGLSKIVRHFFEKCFTSDSDELYKNWQRVYDNSILWTSLVNGSKTVPERKALILFRVNNIEEVHKMKPEQITREMEASLLPEHIEQIKFNDSDFTTVKTAEIFENFTKKTNLFKSLLPISPKSKENTKEWAYEVLELNDTPADEEVVKKRYKELTSRIHPDKFSSLNLNEEMLLTLNANLALVNKAYTFLKK
ncbi:hypothetical protein BIY24_11240 [Halobacteriovorax marinus]|nr:hypothetical protein BIY24_11240 [Halobacteriovorax marinus]